MRYWSYLHYSLVLIYVMWQLWYRAIFIKQLDSAITNGSVRFRESRGETKCEVRRTDSDLELKHWKSTLRRSRLRWLGHVHRKDDSRIPGQALAWFLENERRKPRRTKKSDRVLEIIRDNIDDFRRNCRWLIVVKKSCCSTFTRDV